MTHTDITFNRVSLFTPSKRNTPSIIQIHSITIIASTTNTANDTLSDPVNSFADIRLSE